MQAKSNMPAAPAHSTATAAQSSKHKRQHDSAQNTPYRGVCCFCLMYNTCTPATHAQRCFPTPYIPYVSNTHAPPPSTPHTHTHHAKRITQPVSAGSWWEGEQHKHAFRTSTYKAHSVAHLHAAGMSTKHCLAHCCHGEVKGNMQILKQVVHTEVLHTHPELNLSVTLN